MNVYVQDPVKLCFLCEDGTWSEDVARARDFGSSTDAILFCGRHLKQPYQIVLRFSSEAKYDILLSGPPQGPEHNKHGDKGIH
jgi:hypothetical protein